MTRTCINTLVIALLAALATVGASQAQTVRYWFSLNGSSEVLSSCSLSQGWTLDLSVWYQTTGSFPHNALESLISYDRADSAGTGAVALDNKIVLATPPNNINPQFGLVYANNVGGGSAVNGVRPYGAHLVLAGAVTTVNASAPVRIADLTIRNHGIAFGDYYDMAVYDAGIGDSWTSAIALTSNSLRGAASLRINGAAPQTPVSISDAKSLADGSDVACNTAVVTAVFGSYFYIEETDRTSGILVKREGHGVLEGNSVNVSGVMATDADGERYIDATNGYVNG